MAKLLLCLPLAIILSIAIAGEDMSEDDKKNAKMIFCGRLQNMA